MSKRNIGSAREIGKYPKKLNRNSKKQLQERIAKLESENQGTSSVCQAMKARLLMM